MPRWRLHSARARALTRHGLAGEIDPRHVGRGKHAHGGLGAERDGARFGGEPIGGSRLRLGVAQLRFEVRHARLHALRVDDAARRR